MYSIDFLTKICHNLTREFSLYCQTNHSFPINSYWIFYFIKRFYTFDFLTALFTLIIKKKKLQTNTFPIAETNEWLMVENFCTCECQNPPHFHQVSFASYKSDPVVRGHSHIFKFWSKCGGIIPKNKYKINL